MKKLFGFSEEVEEKMGFNKESNDTEGKSFKEAFSAPEVKDMTFVEVFTALCTYLYGIPDSIWTKKISDISDEEWKAYSDSMDQNIVQFTRT